VWGNTLGGVDAYNGSGGRQHLSRTAGVAGLILIGLALGGCSSLGLPFGPRAAGVSYETVGSIPVSAKLNDSVDPSDWEAIRRTVAAVPPNQAKTLDWSNPDTRSTGAVIALAAKDGSSCRAFATTVSDAKGVRRYSGQLCRQPDGRWQLRAVAPDDALFS
jgi:surface antigen